MKIYSLISGLTLFLALSGCSTVAQKWHDLIGGDPQPAAVQVAAPKPDDLKYSDAADAPIQENKRYRRMTREQFEKEGLTDETGSLWSGDGQNSYLFSANMVRIPGDSVNITLDGEPKKQLSQKATVLAQMMKKAIRETASAAPVAAADKGSLEKSGEKPGEKVGEKSGEKPGEKDKEDDTKDVFTVDKVPARIVERVPDGSYRVRGTQTFMIGKDEFRVIASGLVKSSDISDEGVISSKMMDPKFDIVSMRKSPGTSDKQTELR